MRRLLLAFAVLAVCAGSAKALAPAQLTPDETAVYQGLDGDAASSYLATRGFLRLCQKVASKSMRSLDLPRKPAGYDAQYLSDEEAAIVKKAVNMYVAARINAPAIG